MDAIQIPAAASSGVPAGTINRGDASHLRHGAIYELGEYGAETQGEGISADVRGSGYIERIFM